MKILIRILINVLAVLLAAYIVPGIVVQSIYTALVVALVLGLINITLKPLLLLLTLPITILTLGLFALIINALLFWFISTFIKGFTVAGFIPALFGSLVVSILSAVGHHLTKPKSLA